MRYKALLAGVMGVIYLVSLPAHAERTCADTSKQNDVKFFTIPNECPLCDEARRFLYSEGIAFRELDATHPEVARRLVEGPAHGVVPALHICGEWFLGFGDMTKRQILELFPQPT